MKHINNRIVIDLSKAQHGAYWYVNQECMVSKTLPPKPTVRGRIVEHDMMSAYHPDYPGETLSERASRLELWDTWTPVCTFQLAANHNVTYTGPKATTMWKAWCERVFNRQKKGK